MKSENNYRKCLIKTGDMVQVITGKDKNKKGKIIEFDRKKGYVKVEGMKMQTHFKKNGGLQLKEGNIHISNVMIIDSSNNSITKLKIGKDDKGLKVRMTKKTNIII